MEDCSFFIKVFGNTPVNRLWDFIIDSRGIFDYSMTDICDIADISWNTLKDIFPEFVKEGIVNETRKIGRATMFILNEKNPKAKFMIDLHHAISTVFIRGGEFEIEIKPVKKALDIPLKASKK